MLGGTNNPIPKLSDGKIHLLMLGELKNSFLSCSGGEPARVVSFNVWWAQNLTVRLVDTKAKQLQPFNVW